jgi:subtilisin family serine protease
MPAPCFRAFLGALALTLVALAGCDAADTISESTTGGNAVIQTTPDADAVSGQYVVVLSERPADAARRADLTDVVASVRARSDSEVLSEYALALTGFSARLSPEALAALEADARVAYVEPDRLTQPAGSGTQTPATWGIDRIDQRNRPLNNTYAWDTSGENVTVYVIDTGIRITHNEFSGRASYGYDFYNNDPIADDCWGHGTHVAGTAVGETYGVAKDADVVALRVFGCSGSAPWSYTISAVEWVIANHVAPAVTNMSLSGGIYAPVDAAVENLIDAGVTVAVAGGNASGNACSYSPAHVAEAITLGATNSVDARSWFSNYGSCIDFFAPGEAILSAWWTSNTATALSDGTSMSTPHTAGVAALYLEANPTATPQQVRDALFNATTQGIVTGSNSTNNHLLYSHVAGGSGSISLTATGEVLTNGRWRATLDWAGAVGANVDVRRDGVYGATTPNDGHQVFTVRPFGDGTVDVQVCQQGSTTLCSNVVTLDFTNAPRVPADDGAATQVLAVE